MPVEVAQLFTAYLLKDNDLIVLNQFCQLGYKIDFIIVLVCTEIDRRPTAAVVDSVIRRNSKQLSGIFAVGRFLFHFFPNLQTALGCPRAESSLILYRKVVAACTAVPICHVVLS